jgi:hypothetical protein
VWGGRIGLFFPAESIESKVIIYLRK